MKTPEQQIAATMNSLDGMRRAQAPQRLADRVLQRLDVLSRKRSIIAWPRVCLAAAGLLLLAGINVYVVRGSTRQTAELAHVPTLQDFTNSYFISSPASPAP